jgi:hypothetical protein
MKVWARHGSGGALGVVTTGTSRRAWRPAERRRPAKGDAGRPYETWMNRQSQLGLSIWPTVTTGTS